MSDYDELFRLLVDYLNMKRGYENIIFELTERHENQSLFSNVEVINLEYDEVFNKTDIVEFTRILLNNYVSLNEVLKNQIVYSGISISTAKHAAPGQQNPDLCYNSFDPGFTYKKDQKNIVLVDLANNINHVRRNFDYFFDAISEIYDYINKQQIYDGRLNYRMSGSKLLINSFYSNNLQLKLNITYDSFFYQSKYVDTIVLDLAIPDLTPPTLIFNECASPFSLSLIHI